MTTDHIFLKKYIPEKAVEPVINWMSTYHFQLSIKNNRNTKLGDYRPPGKKQFHRISINRNLNPYSFLITLTHEVAHLVVWEQYKNKAKPHGKEWKETYRMLMNELDSDIFPDDIRPALHQYMKNPHASSTSHLQLSRALDNYDNTNQTVYLESLHEDVVFKTLNGRTFRIHEKMRKRYKCICLNNNRLYMVHPLLRVIPVDPSAGI